MADNKLRESYLETISAYEKEFKPWTTRVTDILKRYRAPKKDDKDKTAKFNILWSNVQTLVPATFSQLPQPDVSRRFRDQDPVGRVASLILERCLDFEVQHYPDYRMTLKQAVYDHFLGGRGVSWVRYEPHFKDSEVQQNIIPDDGLQISEDADEAPVEEQLDYECAPLDYVHWKDFGHEVARSWEETTRVWRNVYMDEDAVRERFGEKIAKILPYDATPEDENKKKDEERKQALIIELWDKATGQAVWISKSHKEFLDQKDDPLKLQEFFPCPRPLYATITNDSLIPVPDFSQYQDQAVELDILSERIKGLAEMLQVKGVYDASADAALARLFKEGENGTLLPVKNWAAFAEKNGLNGQIDVVDLTQIFQALEACYKAMAQGKEQIYEITGIADIIRGVTSPGETLGAQELKANYVGLRLKSMQDDVAQFATDNLRLKAQIMCAKFSPQTLVAMAAVEQLTQEDQQMVPQALALLIGEERLMNPDADSPNPLRSFRIEIAADTLVKLNEQQEKADRMEMLTAFGSYLEKATQVGTMAPQLVPLLVEVGKYGLTSFKVGKQIEGTFDQMLDEMKQEALKPKPPAPPDPAVEQARIKAEGDEQARQYEGQQKDGQRQLEAQKNQIQAGVDVQKAQADANAKANVDIEKERILSAERLLMEDKKIASLERIEDKKLSSVERIARYKTDKECECKMEAIKNKPEKVEK